MKKKDLIRLIREVVKSEVKKVVQSELNEAMNTLEQGNTNGGKLSLTEVMDQTEKEQKWPSMGNFKSDMRAQFAAMNGGPQAVTHTDTNNRPVNLEGLDPSLSQALTRDYSDLVKRFK